MSTKQSPAPVVKLVAHQAKAEPFHKQFGLYRASCSCGWKSMELHRKLRAALEATSHRMEVTRG